MEYRVIPALNREVSVISLGCEGFLDISQEKFDGMFQKAVDLGINFLDMYSPNPQFRKRVGKAIKGRRSDFILQGHIGSVWIHDEYLRTRDINLVKEGFEKQLAELDTDYLDIGMIHYVDAQADFDKVFTGPVYEYARELKTQGKIHAIGMSSHNPLVAKQAVEQGLIDVLMFSVNAAYDLVDPNEDVNILFEPETYCSSELHIDPARRQLYELCEERGVAIDVMKAFGGGDMLDEKLSPFGVAFTEAMCIEYCLSRPGVVAVMAGVHSEEQLDKLAEYFTASPEQIDYASALLRIEKIHFTGSCMYCTHCYPCTAHIKIAEVNKFLNLVKAQKMVPETVKDHYRLLEHKASECVECGVCVSRCPFGVPIIKNMREAVSIFEEDD